MQACISGAQDTNWTFENRPKMGLLICLVLIHPRPERPSGLPLPWPCFSAAVLISFLFPRIFRISSPSLPSLVLIPRGTLHCINQGLSAPHGGYSISTHHLKERKDGEEGNEQKEIQQCACRGWSVAFGILNGTGLECNGFKFSKFSFFVSSL